MRAFTATGTLVKLALRRDRVRLPIWIIGLTVMFASIADSISRLYDTPAARRENAEIRASNIVTRAFTGPAPGDSAGALTVSEGLVFLCVLAALMNILTVVRHTRQNEELGRSELTGSAAVGRHAGLAAALLVAGVANLALGVLTALGLIASGLPATGSFAAGAALGGAGAAFAAISVVAAQLAESARGAIGLASIGLGVAFLLRAAGDALGDTGPEGITVNAAWPSWISPIGWGQQLLPFGENRWWPLVLILVFCALCVELALYMSTHRDVGTGMMPVRRGPVRAQPSLLTPWGLVWRLQRGVLFGWMAGVAVFGAVFGGIGDQVKDLFGSEKSADFMRDLGGGSGSLVDAYFAGMMGLLGVVVAGYTVQALLRMRSDETGGPTEAVLATAVSRPRWLAAHTLVATLGTTLVLALLGASTGLAYGLVSGDVSGALSDLLQTTLAQLPPTLVLAGFVLAVYGLLPRVTTTASWAAFAVCVVLGQFGGLLDLPQGLMDVSPFTHVPNLPAESLSAAPIVVMVGLAAVLATAGTFGLRRRSLALGG